MILDKPECDLVAFDRLFKGIPDLIFDETNRFIVEVTICAEIEAAFLADKRRFVGDIFGPSDLRAALGALGCD